MPHKKKPGIAVIISIGKKPKPDMKKYVGDAMPNAMNKAWETLKALPEQQLHDYDKPIIQAEHDRERGPAPHSRLKTLHPAVAGMLQRRGELDPRGNYVNMWGGEMGVDSGYNRESGDRSSGAKPFRDESEHHDPYQTPEQIRGEQAQYEAEMRGAARGDVI